MKKPVNNIPESLVHELIQRRIATSEQAARKAAVNSQQFMSDYHAGCVGALLCLLEDFANVGAIPAEAAHPSCSLCGGNHPFDTVIPSVRWNAVIRPNGLPDYLCGPCILREFVKRGESFTGDIDGIFFEVRVNNREAKDAADITEENTKLRAYITAHGGDWSEALKASQETPR